MNRTLSRWDDRVFTPENVFTALALVAAIGAAAASRNLLKSGWRATTGTEPPISPESDDATWAQAPVRSSASCECFPATEPLLFIAGGNNPQQN